MNKTLIAAAALATLTLTPVQAEESRSLTTWESYERSREIVDRHLREAREKETLRLLRQREARESREYYERQRERRDRERR